MATLLTLSGIGTQGLNKNLAREQLSPLELWEARNFRTYRGKVQTSPGVLDFLPGSTLSGFPLYFLPWYRSGGNVHLNLVTSTKIYSVSDVGALSNITRVAGDYTAGQHGIWDGVSFKDLAIFTNRADDIQKWDGVAANCVALGGTPPKAGCIFSLMTFVVLGNTIETGGERIVRWSDNGFPETWTGGDSGYLVLYQSPGKILRGLPLGEIAVVYKTDSIHIIYYVGPPFIFGQRQVFADQGLIGARAVIDLGGIHAFWGTDNVYLFNGAEKTPIANNIYQEMIASINPGFKNDIVGGIDKVTHELYFAYPPAGSEVCTKAWVYNYTTGAWRNDNIEITAAASHKKYSSVTWDTIPEGSWDALGGTWDSFGSESGTPVLLVGTSAGKVGYVSEATTNLLGVTRERFIETGILNPGSTLFENESIKCTLEYLEVELEKTGTHNLEIWVGTQNQLTGDADITWTQYLIKCDGSQRKLRITKTARYFAFRFRASGSEEAVKLSGLIVYFNPRGDTQGVG